MRISSVEAFPVSVPRRHPSRSAFGMRSHTDAGVVRVQTEDGVTGWGEISLVWWQKGSGLCRDVNNILAPALIGEDAAALSRLAEVMHRLMPGRHDAPARAGVEMALFDAVGRATGLPVSMLLGGAARDRVNLSISLHMAHPMAMADEAASWVEQGFSTLKIKMGREWSQDLKALQSVRVRVRPDVRVRVDVNEGWSSVPLAARRLHEMEPYEVELVEQPLPGADLCGMAELRGRSYIPLAADEAVWTPRDALQVIAARAADVLNIYVSESGGMLASRHTAELVKTAGLRCWVGSMPELGIGTAANAHLAASIPDSELASDACGFLYHSADVTVAPLEIQAGQLIVPTEPGLGVDVDVEALDHWRLDT